MSTYKLIYFNISGLGEPIRFLLSYSGIKFEDRRVSFEEWPKIKHEMPMGQMPVLEIDGEKYHQMKAISRFIAKRNNLYGSNDFEAMEIDAIADTIDELRRAFSGYNREEDPAVKAKLEKDAKEMLPFILGKFEELLKKNGGFFVAGKLSWADIFYAATTPFVSRIFGHDINKDYPELKKLTEKVQNYPKIKAYLETRPKLMF